MVNSLDLSNATTTALIVEQDGDSRQRLARLLERHGFEVQQCHSVSSVRSLFSSHDLVVLGHTLPASECKAISYWLLSQKVATRPFVLVLQNGASNPTIMGQELVHQVSATVPAVEGALERILRRIALKRNAERNTRPVPDMERPEEELSGGQRKTPSMIFGDSLLDSLGDPGMEPPSDPGEAPWKVPVTPGPPAFATPSTFFAEAVPSDPLMAGRGHIERDNSPANVFSIDEEAEEANLPEAAAPVTMATLVAPPPGTEAPSPKGPEGIDTPWEGILQEIQGAVVILDENQIIRFCNRACQALPDGGPMAESLDDWLKLVALPNQPLEAWLTGLWRDQIPRIISCQGSDEVSPRHLDFRPSLLPDGGLVVTILDVSETHEAEQARGRIQGRFSAVYGASSLGIALVDDEGRLMATNQACHELTGLSQSGSTPPDMRDCLPEETLRALGWPGAIKAGSKKATLLLKTNGQSRDARVWLVPLEEPVEDLASARAVLFMEDLSGETRLRSELEMSQWQNGALIRSLPDLLLLVSENGLLRDVVAPPEHALAPASGPLDGETVAMQFPGISPSLGEAVSECRETGRMALREIIQEGKEGRPHRFQIRVAHSGADEFVALVRDAGPVAPEPDPKAIAELPPEPKSTESSEPVVAETITESSAQKPATEAPAQPIPAPVTPPWERALFAHFPDGLILADLRGRILKINPALEKALGFSGSTVEGKRLAHLYGGSNATAFNREVSEGLSRFRRWEGQVFARTRTGTEQPVWVTFVPLEPESGPKLILGLQRHVPPVPDPPPEAVPVPRPEPQPAANENSREHPPALLSPIDQMELERQQHRYRNQLQTLSALLHLETESDEPGAFPPTLIRELRKQSWRLLAFARLQEISTNEKGLIPLAPFIQALINEIIRPTPAEALRVEISARYADAVLEDIAASAFGLLCVEMLARIREALDTRRDGRGRVEVSVSKHQGEIIFELSGSAVLGGPGITSLGQSSVAMGLLRQLGATLEEAPQSSTMLAYRLRIPLEMGPNDGADPRPA